MKITLAIPTNADWERLNRTRQSILKTTINPQVVDIIIVDNGNTFGHDMTEWVNEFKESYRGYVELYKMPKRAGLTTAWKWCTDMSMTDWTVIINDDTSLTLGWDVIFRNLLEKEPNHDIYLLCHPFNWSGFAVNRAFVKEFPWRTEFPEGYYEDNDIYLRVATARGLTKKSEIYTKAIYCLPYVTEGQPTKFCFTHAQDNAISKRSPHYTRWNSAANLRVFNKYWRRRSPGTPNAIEMKDGNYYVST